MIKTINEQIGVLAAFQLDGSIMPMLLSWRGEKFRDFEIVSTRMIPEGQFAKVYFDLKQGDLIYEIYFYTKDLHWILSKIRS